MKANLISIEPKNMDKLNRYFSDINFMKKVFLFRYERYSENEWEDFCKDYLINKFEFQVADNIVNIDIQIKNEESVIKKIIQFIEEYIDENMQPADSFVGHKVFRLQYDGFDKLI